MNAFLDELKPAEEGHPKAVIQNCPVCGRRLVETYYDDKDPSFNGTCHACGIDLTGFISELDEPPLVDAVMLSLYNNDLTVITSGLRRRKNCVLISLDIAGINDPPDYIDVPVDIGRPATVEDYLLYAKKAYKGAMEAYRKYNRDAILEDCHKIMSNAVQASED